MEKEVFETELKKIVSISKEFGAKKVLLFGSCLEDIESAQDIDIAIDGIKPKEFFKYYGKVSIGSDAHSSSDIGECFEYAKNLVKRNNEIEVGIFQQRKFISIDEER